ncbi:MAG TPA: ABC transporter permease, partial [Blastocatellia bacterium]|nr:ABC transporter permease [Blastocatellia bacterium]
MDSIWQDLRFAIRQLAKSPGVSAMALLALALGIGANTAIFSLVNGALLSPLPGVKDAERLVSLERTQNGRVQFSFAYPDYVDYRDHNSFAELSAHCATPLSFNNGATERLRGDLVSGNYFSVLGVTPAVGRLIGPEDDDQPGAHPVAVLSHRFWRRAFGAEPEAVGRIIKLNGYDFQIIGVASKDFDGTEKGGS